jgi:lysophospholipase L1-like esterase
MRALPLHHLALLGDSIFDSTGYLPQAQRLDHVLRDHLQDWQITLCARGGARLHDIHRQIHCVPKSATHVIMCIGGNDVLAFAHSMVQRGGSPIQLMRELKEFLHRFRADYLLAAQQVHQLSKASAACLLYEPRIPVPLLRATRTQATRAINESVQEAARAAHLDVIDLSIACRAAHDFTDPIHPSVQGLRNIAEQVTKWIELHEIHEGA